MGNRNPMSDALRNRKMNGIDLTIIINDKDADDEAKTLGLAPEGEPVNEDGGDAIQAMDGNQVKGSLNAAAPNDKMQVGEEESMDSNMQPDKMLIEQELAKAGLGMRKKLQK